MGRSTSALVTTGLWATLCLTPAARGDQAERHGDSGVQRPAYQEVLDTVAKLPADHPGWATVVDYGRTAEGRILRLVELADPTHTRDRGPRPAVLISGSTHGNEYLGIEDRLPGWFLAHRSDHAGLARFFAAGGVLVIIPVVNPDGFTHGTRENGRGQDLNRDFDLPPMHELHFREIETRSLAQWLDRELALKALQLRLTVDYHCCDGSLLNSWAYTDAVPSVDQPAFDRIAQLLHQDIDPSYAVGATSAVLGYLAHGTSKDYYYSKYHALAFTFEGSYRDEAGKFARHTVWWDHVLAQVADGARLASH